MKISWARLGGPITYLCIISVIGFVLLRLSDGRTSEEMAVVPKPVLIVSGKEPERTATFQGTWKEIVENSPHKSITEYRCYEPDRYCTEATATLNSNTLSVSHRVLAISIWNSDKIVLEDINRCHQITVDLKIKQAIDIRGNGTNCPQTRIPVFPKFLRLVDDANKAKV